MAHTTSWKRSTQPRKQRAYRRNAPLHTQGTFMHAHLSKDLRKKLGARAIRVRKGDTVKIVRGDFKGKSGKVDRVNMSASKVYIQGIDLTKKDGNKVQRPVHPSNLIIQELDTTDKRRFQKWAKTI